jgi:hypothetical protein
LRLLRALDFIALFMDYIVTKPDLTLAGACRSVRILTLFFVYAAIQAYDQTLSKFHTWTVRKAAGLSFYALPTRENFLETLQMKNEDNSFNIEPVKDFTFYLKSLHKNLHDFYTKHDLHDLP